MKNYQLLFLFNDLFINGFRSYCILNFKNIVYLIYRSHPHTTYLGFMALFAALSFKKNWVQLMLQAKLVCVV